MPKSASSDQQSQLDELSREHLALKREVDQYRRRALLTPTEQRRMAELKKLKLAAKDALVGLRASI
ncbi:MAG: DUF465 domain-containing protein [Proteobacteria bacterium]|nr:DUF465 domain-containing protein [Pseudomonadota bacterium]